jgi:hypothetical protein
MARISLIRTTYLGELRHELHEFAPIDRSFIGCVRIRVVRVFTAAFLRRVFGKRDRRATDPTLDRALTASA